MNRKFCRVLLVCFVALCSAAGCALGATSHVRVVTWNLEWFPGGRPNADEGAKTAHVAKACAKIGEVQPDILLVQEVTSRPALERALGCVSNLQLHVISAFTNEEGKTEGVQQVAVASRLPAKMAWAERWKPGVADPPRGYAFAAVAVDTDKVVLVYALHLKSNGGREKAKNVAKREDATRQLLGHVADMERSVKDVRIVGVIVGGDFNTNGDNSEWVDEKTLVLFREAGFVSGWDGVPYPKRATWLGNELFSPTTFDWLFFRGAALGRPQSRVWPADPTASDHAPVVLDVELKL